MGKLYTKFMSGASGAIAVGVHYEELIDSWVALEDLRIRGAWITAELGWSGTGYPTADGGYVCTAELTFAAQRARDGSLIECNTHVTRLYFGSPASGITHKHVFKSNIFMLPSGDYISMKEGDYLNLFLDARNSLGADASFAGAAIIYYSRGA